MILIQKNVYLLIGYKLYHLNKLHHTNYFFKVKYRFNTTILNNNFIMLEVTGTTKGEEV